MEEEIRAILGESYDEFMGMFSSIINSARHPFDQYMEIEVLLARYGIDLDFLEFLMKFNL